MPVVTLQRGSWRFNKKAKLGPRGGTGTVYAGQGADGSEVAIKVLHYPLKREERMAEFLIGHSSRYVLPILDAGYDDRLGRFAIIMPRADRNLEESLESVGRFDDRRAAEVMLEIATGLTELGDIVHRDLKPRNVLEFEGRNVICDFGISRFLDAATSRNTTREWMTKEYAAPEQWLRGRSTHQTDIYALGCLGYELVEGDPPFEGHYDELQYMHLYEPAPATRARPRLAWLIASMLRKEPLDRPNLQDTVNELERFLRSPPEKSAGFARLSIAAARSFDVRKEAHLPSSNVAQSKRKRMATALCGRLEEYRANLMDRLRESIPAATVERWGNQVNRSGGLYWNERLVANGASISLHIENAFVPHSEIEIPITGGILAISQNVDVLATARLEVEQAHPHVIAHAILLARSDGNDESYDWWEHRLIREQSHKGPSSRWRLHPESHPLDDEHFDSFCERWAIVFADAIEGNLSGSIED